MKINKWITIVNLCKHSVASYLLDNLRHAPLLYTNKFPNHFN